MIHIRIASIESFLLLFICIYSILKIMGHCSIGALFIVTRQTHQSKLSSNSCCIFWPAFGWCACQLLVEICFFKVFGLKNGKKSNKARKIRQLNVLFWVCTQTLVYSFIPRKTPWNFTYRSFIHFCTFSYLIFQMFFFVFLNKINKKHLKSTKKVENEPNKCFDQLLGATRTQKLVKIHNNSS